VSIPIMDLLRKRIGLFPKKPRDHALGCWMCKTKEQSSCEEFSEGCVLQRHAGAAGLPMASEEGVG